MLNCTGKPHMALMTGSQKSLATQLYFRYWVIGITYIPATDTPSHDNTDKVQSPLAETA